MIMWILLCFVEKKCSSILLSYPCCLAAFCLGGLQIQRLSGVDSDFAPFVQHAGVPSIDVYYGRGTISLI